MKDEKLKCVRDLPYKNDQFTADKGENARFFSENFWI